jgi:hypothetical protein
MIGFINTSFMIILNYNQLQQLTVSDCLKLVPFCWTATVFLPLWLDLVLIDESATSSASVYRWLTLYSWTLNYWTELNWTTQLPSEFYYDWWWRLTCDWSKDEWLTKNESMNQSRAEQSSSLLLAASQHGYSWHRAPLGPMAIYLFNVKTFVFFFLSLFLLW